VWGAVNLLTEAAKHELLARLLAEMGVPEARKSDHGRQDSRAAVAAVHEAHELALEEASWGGGGGGQRLAPAGAGDPDEEPEWRGLSIETLPTAARAARPARELAAGPRRSGAGWAPRGTTRCAAPACSRSRRR
jgi:hypothetical protein